MGEHEIKVGQVWETRSGKRVLVEVMESASAGRIARFRGSDGIWRSPDGRIWPYELDAADLVKLVFDRDNHAMFGSRNFESTNTTTETITTPASVEPDGAEAHRQVLRNQIAELRALDVQVGGNHYKDMAIQPVEFIHKNGIGFAAGNVVKYVCRADKKGGVEDLRKARHYIDLLIELQEGEK